MLNMRIVGAGAVFAGFLTLAVANAAAQTAGAPLPLLQFVSHQKTVRARPHPKRIARTEKTEHAKRHNAKRRLVRAHRVVEARRAERPTPTATSKSSPAVTTKPAPIGTRTAAATQPQNIWPAPNPGTQGAIATDAAPTPGSQTVGPQATQGSIATEAVIDTDPNEIMGNAHAVPAATFKAAPPKQVDPPKIVTSPPQATKAAQSAAPASAPASASSLKAGPAHAAAAVPAPVVHAMVATPTRPSSPVGSASWIAQVLAALGGAIAAGVVAWFLIRPSPERTYG